MIRKIFFIPAVLLLAACSSSPKQEESAPVAVEPWDQQAPAPLDAPAAAAPARESRPAAKVSDSRDPWGDLSNAIKAQNDDQVRRSAEIILARVPGDERALNALAMTAYKKGQFDLAGYYLGKALQAHPNKGGLHSNLGLVQLAKNERAAAIRSFRKALELDSNDGVAAANLGSIYIQQRDYTKAAIVLATATKRGPRDAKTLGNFGIALAALGNYDKAGDAYEAALKENPNSREAMLNYAILLVDHLNKPKEGLDVINRLKFMGAPAESRERLSSLENKAKAGVK